MFFKKKKPDAADKLRAVYEQAQQEAGLCNRYLAIEKIEKRVSAAKNRNEIALNLRKRIFGGVVTSAILLCGATAVGLLITGGSMFAYTGAFLSLVAAAPIVGFSSRLEDRLLQPFVDCREKLETLGGEVAAQRADIEANGPLEDFLREANFARFMGSSAAGPVLQQRLLTAFGGKAATAAPAGTPPAAPDAPAP